MKTKRDELVQRLRFNASAGVPDFTNSNLLDEAADRIEALEEKLERADVYIKGLESGSDEWAETVITLDNRIADLEVVLRDTLALCEQTQPVDKAEYEEPTYSILRIIASRVRIALEEEAEKMPADLSDGLPHLNRNE